MCQKLDNPLDQAEVMGTLTFFYSLSMVVCPISHREQHGKETGHSIVLSRIRKGEL
jgi:hypothetical protein